MARTSALLRPSPNHPFCIAARVSGLLVAGAGFACGHGAFWFVLVAAIELLRVPSRRLVLENALLLLAAGALASHGTPAPPYLVVAGAVAASMLLAPEAHVLPFNSLDRWFIAQEYGAVAMNSLHTIDTIEPLDRAAVVAATRAFMEEVPMMRSFVREAWWGSERFATRRPWMNADDLVEWSSDESAAREWLGRPLDLERTPPVRVVHSPRDGGGHRLTLLVHHSATDGDAGFRLFGRFLGHYNAHRGRAVAPLPPLVPGPRIRTLLRRNGWGWMARVMRTHFHPLAKMNATNANLMDDPRPQPFRVRVRTSEISAATFESLKGRATALGVSRNDLLVASSARAVLAHLRGKREKGKEDRPLCVLLPVSLREELKVPDCLGNYVGAARLDLTPATIDAEDFASRLSGEIRRGRELDQAVGTAINVATFGALFPIRFFRSALKKLDGDPTSSFFTYLISSPRLPPGFERPDGVRTERVGMDGPLTRRPAFGFVLTIYEGRVIATYEYLSPLVSEPTVTDVDARFRAEVERLAGEQVTRPTA